MFLAYIVLYKLFTPGICEQKRELTEYREEFNGLFDQLVSEVTSHIQEDVTYDAILWMKLMIEYTVPGGKQNRGLSVINAYQLLVGRAITELEKQQAFVLGWCIEWLQAFFLVADDVMDSSILRRGRICWYRREEVGNIAINDAFLLESGVFILLKKYFRLHSHYINMIELFHEVCFQTELGQTLDLITSPTERDKVKYELFTIERYCAIVKYKTAYYSFYLPISLALLMNGIDNRSAHNEAKIILLKIGEYFQIQDDFLDCYGDPVAMGKLGTDIEEGKCSWLAVKAMELMTIEQTERFKDNYAQNDTKCVQNVKVIYNELDLPTIFSDYENVCYFELCELINENCKLLPKEIFFDFLNKIFKRKA